MDILNDIYVGFDEIEDVIMHLNEMDKEHINNFKVVKFNKKYYGVGIESPLKQILICRNIVWYRDEEGYLQVEEISNFKAPYAINKAIWFSFTDTLYKKCIEKGIMMSLSHIQGGNTIICNNPVNSYFTLLINIFTDYFIPVERFGEYRYSSDKNIELMKKYLIQNENFETVAINPYRGRIRIKINEETIEIPYKPIISGIKNYMVGFQVKPVMESEKGVDLVETIKANDVLNMKNDNQLMIKYIFQQYPQLIKELAKNRDVELSEGIIGYLLRNELPIGEYIQNLDEKRKNQILSKNGLCLKYIEAPSLTMIMNAAWSTPESIKIAEDKLSYAQLMSILRDNKECIKYINNFTANMQKELLEDDIANSAYFSDMDYKLVEQFLIKLVDVEGLSESITSKIVQVNRKKEALLNPIYMERKPEDKKLAYIYDNMLTKVANSKVWDMQIINSEDCLSSHIEYLYRKLNCTHVDIACGFLRQSGLYLLDTMIGDLIEKNIEFNMIIGSLKDYISGISCKDIDRGTAEQLNVLMYNNNVSIRTYKDRFYHGKIYYLYGEKYTGVICGSSNVSKNGMYGNKETNIVFIFSNSSQKLKDFKVYFESFWKECVDVGYLDLDMFELDEEVNEESRPYDKNSEVEREFAYLRELNPTQEIDYIPIFKGYSYENQYRAFYYEQYNNLLVLDSLEYQNAIYIFERVNGVEEFLDSLERKDATALRKEFRHRVNHIQDGSHRTKVKQLVENMIKKNR